MQQLLASTLRQVAEDYARALESSWGDALVSVVLFGSVARGEVTEHSDIDLLVIARGLPAGRLARQDRLRDADGAIASRLESLRKQGVLTDVSPILKTPEEAARIIPLYPSRPPCDSSALKCPTSMTWDRS